MAEFGRPDTLEEQTLLVRKVIQIGIEVCMGNHIYCFKGELYRQGEGGAIGGKVRKIAMDDWLSLMEEILEENYIDR